MKPNYFFLFLFSSILISQAHFGHLEDYKDLFFDQTPNFGSNDILRIHMIPHSHEDVGWLKTVDECYYGANNAAQPAGV